MLFMPYFLDNWSNRKHDCQTNTSFRHQLHKTVRLESFLELLEVLVQFGLLLVNVSEFKSTEGCSSAFSTLVCSQTSHNNTRTVDIKLMVHKEQSHCSLIILNQTGVWHITWFFPDFLQHLCFQHTKQHTALIRRTPRTAPTRIQVEIFVSEK